MNLPVISATTIGVGSTMEFIAWIGEQRDTLRRDLVRDGALLVRGLPVLDGPESFGLIAREFAPSLRNYVEGQSRRDELAPQVYNSTHHPADLKQLPHPWLVIEDAHQNVYEVLRHFDSLLEPGDYLVVEDLLSLPKYAQTSRFLSEARGRYVVDTHYTDMFGYNATWNLNGYLKRI